MKKVVSAIVFLTAAVLGLSSSTAQEASFEIIVHAENPSTAISQAEATEYFLKKKARWPDGVDVAPVDQVANSPVRESFSRRSVASIQNLWQRQIFSGRQVPPPEVASNAEVIARVQVHRGAIGYVTSGAALPDSVKILKLDG